MKEVVIRRTRRITLAVVAVAALSAGCGGSGGRDDASEQAYLDGLYAAARDKGSGIHGYGDERVLRLGRDACSRLADGELPGDVVADYVAQDVRGVSSVASEVVGFAELHLCPEVGDPERADEGGGLGDAFRGGFERGMSGD